MSTDTNKDNPSQDINEAQDENVEENADNVADESANEQANDSADHAPDDISLVSSIRKVILGDQVLTKFLVAETTASVITELMEREKRRQRIWVIAGAILAGIGITGIIAVIDGRVHNALTTDATKEIMENVGRQFLSTEVDKLRNEIEVQGRFQRLAYHSFTLDFSDSFSNLERDSIMEQLMALRNEESLLDDSSFPTIMEKIVTSLAAADLLEQINKIVTAYGSLVLDNGVTGPILSNTYGRHLLYAERHNVESADALRQVFLQLEASSRANDFPGAFKPWRVALDLLEKEGDEEREAVVRHFDELTFESAVSKAQAVILFVSNSRSEWYQQRREKTTAVVTELYSEILENYGDQVARLWHGSEGGEVLELVVAQLNRSSSSSAEWFMDWVIDMNSAS